MHIFEMRDMTPVEAIVLAPDYDRAFALFEQHLHAHGGDPDALLWRQLGIEHLQDDAEAAVQEALKLDREGLVTCDTAGQWVFVTPLGAGVEARPGVA
jgi:hypothetical protein